MNRRGNLMVDSAVADATSKLWRTVARSTQNAGGMSVSEADRYVNDASRNLVEAFQTAYGQAWLGRINLRGNDRGKPEAVMWKWDRDGLCNFGADFVAMDYDQRLVDLIIERDSAEYAGTEEDGKRLELIFDRMTEIGAEYLVWS